MRFARNKEKNRCPKCNGEIRGRTQEEQKYRHYEKNSGSHECMNCGMGMNLKNDGVIVWWN